MFMKKATLQGPRERMTNTQLLMTISICIFVALYAAAVFGIQGFDKPNMFFDLINGNAPIIIVACALTIVMIGGGIDISVGGVIMVSAMSCSRFLYDTGIEDQTVAVLAALLVSLGVGLAFGLLHGFLVSYLGIQPFIVTLAGMQLAKGVASMIYNDWMSYQKLLKVRNPNAKVTHAGWKLLQDIKIEIPWLGYEHPATGKWVSTKIEMGAVIAVAIVILVFLMLRYTKKGRHIYAVGGNHQSALMLGINVKRTRFLTYIMSGLLSGLAGFVYLIHSASADITSVGVRNEMDAIASSIIGGTLLTGGVGNVIGTFFGAMILISLKQIIKMAPWVKEAYWQEMISGAMLGFFIVLQSIVLSSRGKFHPIKWIKADGDKSKMARRLLLLGAITCWLEAIIGKLSGQYLTPAVTMALSGVCVIAYVVILANEANAKSVRDMLAAFMAEKEGLVEEPEQPEKVLCEPKAAVKLQKEKQDS